MRFEKRELKPYAEPVSPEELKTGKTYFAVLFLDDAMRVPILEPKVFVGSDLQPGDEGRIYFQDYDSYQNGVRFDSATADDEAVFETGAENHVFDYEHALDRLMVCALRRRKPKNR